MADQVSRQLLRLRDHVEQLLAGLTEAESAWLSWLTAVAPEHRVSARNLVHYWAIRQHDALGHPFGMTGAQITTMLLNNLPTYDKTIGLETMCVGGARGVAMVIERLF